MHKKLKRKFTMLSTFLTGLVLFAACMFSYSSAKLQIENKYQTSFENQSQTLSVFLAGTRQIRFQQLYQMEQEGKLLIYFFDNGALLYHAESSPQNRDLLYEDFAQNLQKEYPDLELNTRNASSPVNITIEFRSGGIPYLGKYVSTTTEGRNWYSFYLVQPVTEKYKETQNLIWLYILIFTGGLCVLLCISWLLAKLTVKPAEQAHKHQTEFIAAASHELKSPLSVIAASTDYAKTKPEATQASLDKILAESRRMAALVDDLLILSGSETAGWQLRKETVNIENTLLTVYENYLPIVKKSGHQLKLVLPENDIPDILADEQRVIQTVSILLSNAIAYSPPGTSIELAIKATKKHLLLSVVDHGEGIAEEDKSQIFEKFYRSDKSRNSKSHFGLGLSVARELAELHGGKILLEDTPGGGATFSFLLPAGA